MKESSKSVELRRELEKKRNERRGSESLSEAIKSFCIEGRGTPSDLIDFVDVHQGGSWRARCNIGLLNLDPEEGGKNSSTSEMAESEHATSSNHSDLREDIEDDFKSTVRSYYEIQSMSMKSCNPLVCLLLICVMSASSVRT
jgi:hypothetical protein